MKNPIHTQNKQTGSALIVSLMIMVVMTVLGISSISSTNLEERMSQNFQHNTMVFQAAESTINNIMKSGDEDDVDFYDVDSDPLRIAATAGAGDTSTIITFDLDPNDYLANTTLSATATVVYEQEVDCFVAGVSMDSDLSCLLFEVSSNASLGATSTTGTHIQGISRLAPSSGS